MKRIHPKTGETFLPHRFEKGVYKLGDPAKGRVKHHASNAIEVASLKEAEALVRKGFSLRMRGQTSGVVNLISPASIAFDQPKSSSPSG